MFTFSLMGKWPWDSGIAPDVANENAEVYVEEYLTKRLRIDNNGNSIPKMKQWYVALVHFMDGSNPTWIISDGKGVLDASASLEQIGACCDKWMLVNTERSKHG